MSDEEATKEKKEMNYEEFVEIMMKRKYNLYDVMEAELAVIKGYAKNASSFLGNTNWKSSNP